jgi:regulator of nucleoside diphosphate kinase
MPCSYNSLNYNALSTGTLIAFICIFNFFEIGGLLMEKKTAEKKLVLLDTDVSRLLQLCKTYGNHQYCKTLIEEIGKAQIVDRMELPKDVVTMYSEVEIYDIEDKEASRYVLVYPWEADADSNKLSILAPIGTAIIGYRQGDEIMWKVPGGTRSLRITAVRQSSDKI